MVSGLTDNGCQFCATGNGLLSFVFTPSEAVTSVTFSSDGTNAFEVAQVSSSGAVPEPSTWAMMVLGFAGLGYAAFRGNSKGQALAI